VSASDSSDPLGTIEWDITEAPDWKCIYRSRRDLTGEDVDVLPPPEYVRQGPRPKRWSPARVPFTLFDFYRKRVRLEGGFFFELVWKPTRERRELVGFGLSGQRTTANTFSWEWFNFDGDERAKKLQEGGELRARTDKGPRGWEVVETEFVTDISLRLRTRTLGCLLGMIFPPKTLWRIRLLRGSHIAWPLTNGDTSASPPN
jgi:hypothetical protein